MARVVPGDAYEAVGHLLRRRDRFELTLGQLDGDVERELVTDVDDLGQRTLADEQPPAPLDGTLRRREADARRPPVAERLEPFQREREVRAALVAGDGVDLVDDDGLGRPQRFAAARARHEEIERLRCRDYEAGWPAHHRRALR